LAASDSTLTAFESGCGEERKKKKKTFTVKGYIVTGKVCNRK